MAIARDASTTHDGGTASSFSFSHTCTGSDLVLVVLVAIADTGNVQTVTGVTYNGVTMTKMGTDAIGTTNARRTNMWLLIGPATGAHNVSVTLSGGASAWTRAISVSYTGCDQTTQPNVTAQTVANTSTSVSQSVTTTADNCALVGCGLGGGNDLTAGANTVQVAQITGPDDPIFWESSPLAQTPAGSHSLAYTSPGAYDLPLIVGALTPSGGGAVVRTYSNLLLMGVG